MVVEYLEIFLLYIFAYKLEHMYVYSWSFHGS